MNVMLCLVYYDCLDVGGCVLHQRSIITTLIIN